MSRMRGNYEVGMAKINSNWTLACTEEMRTRLCDAGKRGPIQKWVRALIARHWAEYEQLCAVMKDSGLDEDEIA